MVARLQRFLLLAALCVTVTLAAVPGAFGHFWWGAGVVALAVSTYPLVLAVELGMASLIAQRSDCRSMTSSPGAKDWFRAWVGEMHAGIKAFAWEQPFRATAEADRLPASSHGKRGVVLVHGLFCNRGFWNPWMRQFRAQTDIPFVAVDLEPMFCSIDEYAQRLESAVAQMLGVTGLAPVVVAHSMGGLVVRKWLAEQGTHQRVHRVVTIGTPHGGTWLARFARSRNGQEMRLDSLWLQRLALSARPEDASLFTCFYGNCDNVVFPPERATLLGADNRMLSGNGHVQLAAHPTVKAEVELWLGTDSAFGRLSTAARPPSPADAGR